MARQAIAGAGLCFGFDRPGRYAGRLMWRRTLVVSALCGAAIGCVPVIPIGHSIVDGVRGCVQCGAWTILLIGARIRDPYPYWLPMLAAAAGAVVALALTAGFLAFREHHWRILEERDDKLARS
jgi:hypothetical protein